jgi:hypothetical protein
MLMKRFQFVVFATLLAVGAAAPSHATTITDLTAAADGAEAVIKAALNATQAYSGFLTIVPEPGTGLLVIAGLLGLAGWRRASH